MLDEPLRLIEDCLPLDIISDRAAREKNQHTGNLASIHLWWGRKPQIAARAATYAALVPAPHDTAQRMAYLHQLAALCTTDVSAGVLRQARRQIAEVHAERMRSNGTTPASRAPLVLDLFAGGGAIPLEALRLGCDVLSSDLNPVAYLIELCTIVYPQRFPDIAQIVASWGRRLLDEVRAAVADLYPPMVFAETDSVVGESATPAPLVLVYAHKTTAGWASVVEALRSSGFMVTEAWPINTESRGRVRAQNSAALASSIFIVARKRAAATIGNYTRDVLPELLATVRERVQTLTTAGIGGADLVIATVGGGLRAYTRYARVERDNGDELSASIFLEEVQRAALATILEHVVGLDHTGVSAVDATSQYYVLARYQYSAAAIDFDDANVLARGVGVELDGSGSLTSGANPLLAKEQQTVQLRDYRQRGAAHDLGMGGDRPAPLIDILQRLLWLNEHQPTAILQFLTAARPDTSRLKLVAEAIGGRRLAAEPTPGASRDERTEEQKAIGRLLPVWQRVVEEPSQRHGTSTQTTFLKE